PWVIFQSAGWVNFQSAPTLSPGFEPNHGSGYCFSHDGSERCPCTLAASANFEIQASKVTTLGAANR
ncbi:hypothetical protein ACOQNQ_08755, partial [Pseudomonas juntendi]|uniref:hypothetical protein n=1 Tax=Pseudomonas juntendi TaxID=2666183 RepID=UPI003B9270EE